MRVMFQEFRGTFKTWKTLMKEAADFASGLDPQRLVSISHSSDNGDGVIAVWYWDRPAACPTCGYTLTGIQSKYCPECGTAV